MKSNALVWGILMVLLVAGPANAMRFSFLEVSTVRNAATQLAQSVVGMRWGLTPDQDEVVEELYDDLPAPALEERISHEIAAGTLVPTTSDHQAEMFNLVDALLRQKSSAGDVPAVEELLDVSADPNAAIHGQRALDDAVKGMELRLSEALLEGGADPNAENGEGLTPMYEAVQSKNRHLILLLVEYGGDLNKPSANGYTPFQRALLQSPVSLSLIEDLVARGGDVNSPDPDGRTPLDIAAGNAALRRVLIDAGAIAAPAPEGEM